MAVPRFYFHVRTPVQFICDCEGAELPDVEAAKREAELDAREMIVAAVRKGEAIDHPMIEIADNKGAVACTYPVRDAIKLN